MEHLSNDSSQIQKLQELAQEAEGTIQELQKGELNGQNFILLTSKSARIIETIQIANKILTDPHVKQVEHKQKLSEHLFRYVQQLSKISDLMEQLNPNDKSIQDICHVAKRVLPSNADQEATQIQHSELDINKADSNSPRAEMQMQNAILASEKIRDENLSKIQKLNWDACEHTSDRINVVKASLKKIENLIQARLEIKKNASAESSTLKTIEDHLDKEIQKFIDAPENLKLNTSAFYSLLDSEATLIDFQIHQEVFLNTIVNDKLYLLETEAFIKDNLEEVLLIFCPHYEKNTIDPRDVNMKIEFFDEQEGHNGGKKPVKVNILSENNLSVTLLVCKPRMAVLDAAVIETFQKINNLPREQKSGDYDLPTFKIVNPREEANWKCSNREVISLWEYVKGDTVMSKLSGGNSRKSVGACIISLNDNQRSKNIFLDKLNRMHTILKAMTIGDLHSDNVMISGISSEKPELIPVDLEVFGADGTELGASEIKLENEEQKLIAEFKSKVLDYPKRILPKGTQSFVGQLSSSYSSYKKAISNANGLIKEMKKDYQMLMDADVLREKILLSLLNRDVPFFTTFKGEIYYGLPDGNPLGKLT